jgi:hypothetical protein
MDEQLPEKDVRPQNGAGREKRGLAQWINMVGK